jgi:hypothetical protein
MTAQVSKLIDINDERAFGQGRDQGAQQAAQARPGTAPTLEPQPAGGQPGSGGAWRRRQGPQLQARAISSAMAPGAATRTSQHTARLLSNWDRGGSLAVSTDATRLSSTTPSGMKLIRPFLINDAALSRRPSARAAARSLLEGDMGRRRAERWKATRAAAAARRRRGGDDEWARPRSTRSATVTVTATDYHHSFESSRAARRTRHDDDRQPLRRHLDRARAAAGTPITFTTTGALPTGLAVGTSITSSRRSPTRSTSRRRSAARRSTRRARSRASTPRSPTRTSTRHRAATRASGSTWAPRTAGRCSISSTAANRRHRPDRGVIETGGARGSNAVALINIDAAEVQIVSETDDGEVYNETFSHVSTDGITDWYAYFFEEIVRKQKLVVAYLPPYVAQTLTVILTDNGTVGLGTLIIGQTQGHRRTDLRRRRRHRRLLAQGDRRLRQLHDRRARLRDTADVKVWCDTNRVDDIKARSPPTAPRPSFGSATELRFAAHLRLLQELLPGIHRPEQILLHS